MFKNPIFEIELCDFRNENDISAFVSDQKHAQLFKGNKFNFVGLISKSDKLIFIFPKNYTRNYLDNLNIDALQKEFGLIYRVLNKVNREMNVNSDSQVDFIDNQQGGSELAIANSIIQDYISYGIYNKLEELITIDANNEIHWESTISLIQPLFSRKSPIYPDLYSFGNMTPKDYVITQIHKWSVSYCLKKYGNILFDEQPVFEDDVVSEISEIGDRDYLLSCINKELSEVFLDRHTRLLQLIKSLIEKKNTNETEEIIFGTTSFHVVWERVCQFLFNDEKSKYEEGMKEWSQPIYNMEGYKSTPRGRMYADILSINANAYFIIDAKYYKMEDEKGRPGVQDVAKQYLYEQIYEDHILNGSKKKFVNLFVSPMSLLDTKSNNFFKILGNVSIQHFNNKKIDIIVLNTHIVYDSYLRNELRGYNELHAIEEQVKIKSND